MPDSKPILRLTTARRSGILAWIVLFASLSSPGFAIDPARLASARTPDSKPAAWTPDRFRALVARVEKNLAKQGAPDLSSLQSQMQVLTFSPTFHETNVYEGPSLHYLTLELLLLNSGSKDLSVDPATIVLKAGDRKVRLADWPVDERDYEIVLGERLFNAADALPARPIPLPAGRLTSVPLAFASVDAREAIPTLTLELELAGETVRLDLNRLHNSQLELEAATLGPQDACGLLTIRGMLDGINAGLLAGTINDMASRGIRRYVVEFAEGSTPPTSIQASWLASMAVDGDLSLTIRNLPALPTNVAELRFVNLPEAVIELEAEGSRARRSNGVESALIAALWAPYRYASRSVVLKELQSGDPRGRAAALMCGSLAFQESDLPRLLQLVNDSSATVRESAANVVAGFDSDAARQTLTEVVATGTAPEAEAALTALLGARLARNVAAGVDAAKGKTRISPRALLKIQIQSRHPAFHEAIRQAARSGPRDSRLLALAAMGQMRVLLAEDVFADAFASPDAELRRAALNAAATRLQFADHEVRDQAIVESLKQLKSNPSDPDARKVALLTRDPRFVSVLAVALEDKNLSMAERAGLVDIICHIGGQRAVDFLQRRFDSFNSEEQNLALEHLGIELPSAALVLAARALRKGDTNLVSQATRILTADGSDASVAVLNDALRGDSQSYRSELLEALATIGSPSAFDVLIAFRDRSELSDRALVIGALRNYWTRSPAFEPAQLGVETMNQQLPPETDDLKEAIKYFDAAIEIDPLLPQAYTGRGNARLRLEDWSGAERDFAAAQELHPDDEISLTGLMISKVMVGKEQEALRWLTAATSYYANDTNFRYNAACTLARALERRLEQPATADRDAAAARLRDAAFENLNRSIQLGFSELDLLEKDPDLGALHADPRFAQAVEKMKAMLLN